MSTRGRDRGGANDRRGGGADKRYPPKNYDDDRGRGGRNDYERKTDDRNHDRDGGHRDRESNRTPQERDRPVAITDDLLYDRFDGGVTSALNFKNPELDDVLNAVERKLKEYTEALFRIPEYNEEEHKKVKAELHTVDMKLRDMNHKVADGDAELRSRRKRHYDLLEEDKARYKKAEEDYYKDEIQLTETLVNKRLEKRRKKEEAIRAKEEEAARIKEAARLAEEERVREEERKKKEAEEAEAARVAAQLKADEEAAAAARAAEEAAAAAEAAEADAKAQEAAAAAAVSAELAAVAARALSDTEFGEALDVGEAIESGAPAAAAAAAMATAVDVTQEAPEGEVDPAAAAGVPVKGWESQPTSPDIPASQTVSRVKPAAPQGLEGGGLEGVVEEAEEAGAVAPMQLLEDFGPGGEGDLEEME